MVDDEQLDLGHDKIGDLVREMHKPKIGRKEVDR